VPHIIAGNGEIHEAMLHSILPYLAGIDLKKKQPC